MTFKIPVIALLVIYMTAMIGFITPSQQAWYLSYTPYFLLFNAALLLAYATEKSKKLLVYSGVVILGSFLIELGFNKLGFSQYGKSFGIQLGGVPLLMGVFWFVAIYSANYIAEKIPVGKYLKMLMGTFIAIALFAIIHQNAIKLDFWQQQTTPPALNYIAPLLISFLFSFITFQFKIITENKMAVYVYGGFFVFFVAMFMFLK